MQLIFLIYQTCNIIRDKIAEFHNITFYSNIYAKAYKTSGIEKNTKPIVPTNIPGLKANWQKYSSTFRKNPLEENDKFVPMPDLIYTVHNQN